MNARANEPKPLRVTPPGSDAVPEGEGPVAESALKKLRRVHDPLDPPWVPDENAPRAHPAPACGGDGAAIPGPFGSQFAVGISA